MNLILIALLSLSNAFGANGYSDIPVGGGGSGAVSSVFGRTGDVTSETGDYNSDQITEGSTNLFFTDQRARSALSVGVPLEYDSVTGIFSLTAAASGVDGYLSGSDWDSFNAKVDRAGDSMSGPLTLSGNPTLGGQAANKSYVDSLAQGLKWKTLVSAASTADLTLSGEQTIDGEALVAGDRVLAKDESAQDDNGCYVVAVGAWARCTDSDTGTEMELAAYIANMGTVNGGKAFIQTTPSPITIDVTSLVFVNFLSTTYSATEQGIKLIGTQFSLSLDGSSLSQSASGAKVADGGISNTQVNAAAAIARSKLASGSANRILVNNGSGVMTDHTAQTANAACYYDANGLPASMAATYSSVTQDLTLTGNINLPTTSSTDGRININSIKYLHGAGSESVYVGPAGALTNTGSRNVGIGQGALVNLTTAQNNTGIGYNSLSAVTVGNANVAVGQVSMGMVTTGSSNTGVGALAGQNVGAANSFNSFFGYAAGRFQTNSSQTAFGYNALAGNATPANNTGTFNTAIGYAALLVNSSGGSNVAIGTNAGTANTSGGTNFFGGVNSGLTNTTGSSNTFTGYYSGYSNASGSSSTYTGTLAGRYQISSNLTAFGYNALAGNSTPANNTGTGNTAIGNSASIGVSSSSNTTSLGSSALGAGTTGVGGSTAIGYASLFNATAASNTAVGESSGRSITGGSSNVFIGTLTGFNAGQAIGASNSIAIGAAAFTTASNQMAIGSGTSQITDAYIGAGTISAVAPTSVTLQPTTVTPANTQGWTFNIAGGKSTGTGTAGTINFQTSSVGISGSAVNPLLTRISILPGGTIQGAYMHNNITDAQGSAVNGQIRSGTYTPSAGATTNIAASTPRNAMWSRVGNIVTVSGTIDITYSAVSTASTLVLSLPVPSANFTTTYQGSGSINVIPSAGTGPIIGQIYTNIGAATVTITTYSNSNGASQEHRYTFQYEVI